MLIFRNITQTSSHLRPFWCIRRLRFQLSFSVIRKINVILTRFLMRFLAVAFTVILLLQWHSEAKIKKPLHCLLQELKAIYDIALTKRPKLGIPYMNYWWLWDIKDNWRKPIFASPICQTVPATCPISLLCLIVTFIIEICHLFIQKSLASMKVAYYISLTVTDL